MSNISLRRYTSLPFLLDLLFKQRLALLDPATWDDRNDAFFMEMYKKSKGLKTLLAVCFAEAQETYHHWKVYSGNASGVCIEFDKDRLREKLIRNNEFRCEAINYLAYRGELRSEAELPFTKRVAFKGEDEFRIIYENMNEEIKIKYLSITPEDILQIVINPWVNKSVYDSITSIIRKVDGFENTRIRKSSILENEKWKEKGANVVVPKGKA